MPGFSSTYSPLFLLLFIVISIAVSYYFYRKSIVSNAKKIFLITLKSLAVFLLLFLFIEPALSSLLNRSSDKLNIILIDNSRSNKLKDKDKEIEKIIEENSFFSGDFEVFKFSNTVTKIEQGDSIGFYGYETDLNSALRNIKNSYPGRDFNSITVISDGIFNSGGNPLYEAKMFQAPFITYAVGDSIQQKDVVVTDIAHNEKSFINITTKVKAYVNVYGYSGAIKVNLIKEGILVSSEEIAVNQNQQNYEAEFDVIETNPGKTRYRIETENKENELTYKNNYSDFYIEYIDNKVNVLVISGGPGYDDAFITSILKRINNYNITFKTAKSPAEFYEGGIDFKSFPELSAVFFLNYPTTQSSSNIVSDLASNIKTFNIPLIFFAGKNSDYQKLQALEELIPFSIGRINSGETLFSLQIIANQDNPVSKLNEVNSTSQIFRNISAIQPKPGAVTLATDKFSGEPVMINRITGNFKSTAFLGYGLWRWKLNSSSNAEKTLEKFLLETINITLQKEKKTKFKVYSAKDIFDINEPVIVKAEVYDENYIPTRNAIVTGKIIRKDGTTAAELKFTGEENKYTSSAGMLSYEDYKIQASSELNGNFYANSESRFFVDTLNTEFLVTKTNNSFLRELSLNTGGRFIGKSESGAIKNIINDTKNSYIQENSLKGQVKFNLWENKYILGLIILLFAVEWILRKRNNIP